MRTTRFITDASNRRQNLNCGMRAGYTLVELAVVLLIAGMFVASGLQVLKLYNKQKAFQTTDSNMSEIVNQIHAYLEANGHYPCPARLDVPRTDSEYGMEGDCDDTSVAIGTCADGICVEESVSQIDLDNDGTVDAFARVRRGAVPFRVLSLKGNPEAAAYDGFGRRIEYVVTERLASATLLADFDPADGGISVVDSDDNPVIPDMTHMLLMSRGENGVAAWSRDGVQLSGCPATGKENENCNTDTTTPERKAIYRSDVRNLTAANFFDDIISYRATIDRPLWKATDASKIDITDLVVAGGGVGAGGDPDPFAGGGIPKLKTSNASDDIRAQGDFMISAMCDENQDACFPVQLIGGSGMRCPAGQYMIGIQSGLPQCINIPAPTCPSGQFMSGIDSNLRPICSDPPNSCDATNVTFCSVTQALPAAFQGTQIYLYAGDTRYQRYRCGSSGWYQNGSGGSCTCPSCTPDTWTNVSNCPSYMTGQQTTDYERACFPNLPPAASSTACSYTWQTGSTNTCECDCADGGVDGNGYLCRINGTGMSNRTKSCPSGFNSGQQTRQCPRICSSSGSGTRNPACSDWQSSYAGYSCETLGCTPWDDSACQCTARSPQVQQDSCPWGYAGTGERREKYWNCPGGPSSPGSWDSNWTVVSPANCTCDPMSEERDISCGSSEASSYGFGSGYGGTIRLRRETSACPNPTWDPWFVKNHTCYTLQCNRQPGASGSEQGTDFVGVPISTPCTCGTGTAACYRINGQNDYTNYYACPCTPVN